MKKEILKLNKYGIYCPIGDFYIDPWKPVENALITHGHSDHARWGMKKYLCQNDSVEILKTRLGKDINIQGISYKKPITINGVKVSYHPAGHILGSSQIRVEYKGEVAVVSGDYKIQPDSTCANFEMVKCNTFVTESTFALPIYNWENEEKIFESINKWWQSNAEEGVASIIYGYALGKSQRILSILDSSIGPIYTHGAVENITEIYRKRGVKLPSTTLATNLDSKTDFSKSIVIAPSSADGTTWLRKFGDISTAFASGWMQVRGNKRRGNFDKGFVMSDHVDWCGVLDTIKDTGAENVWITHGYSDILSRYLNERGYNSKVLETLFDDSDI